jgi:hypothetical protein
MVKILDNHPLVNRLVMIDRDDIITAHIGKPDVSAKQVLFVRSQFNIILRSGSDLGWRRLPFAREALLVSSP